jgi:hypothetical protein
MVWAFDMDGTVVEAWYGEYTPAFYLNDEDAATRGVFGNIYEYVKPLPYVNDFLADILLEDPKAIFVLISRLSSGKEFVEKIPFILDKFKDADSHSYFKEENIFGTVKDEDKWYILQHFAKQDDVVYFDDTLSTLSYIAQKSETMLPAGRRIFGVHSTSIYMRTPKEIITSFKAYKEGKN